jgi:MFS family permease
MRLFRLSFGLRALFLSAFLLLAGNAIQNIYIPTRAVELGFGFFPVSLLGSLYFLGFIVGCLLVPPYLYRVGHIRTFAAFAALAAVAAILISNTASLLIWLPLRFVTGFSLAALYLSVESWISAFSENSRRGRILSIYRLTDLLGSVIGQLFLFGVGQHPSTLDYVAVLLMLSLIPITLTQIQMPTLVEAVPEHLLKVFKKTYKGANLSFWGVLCSGIASGIFWSLIPVFVKGLGHNSSHVPLVVSSYLIGGFISQWPVGIWSDRVDRRLVLLILSFLSFLVAVFITLGAHLGKLNLVNLAFLVGLFGVGGIPIYPISVAHANDWMKKISVVDLSVLLLVTSSLGSVLGPAVAGSLLKKMEPQNLFVFVALSHGSLLLITAYRLFRDPPIPKEIKTEFLDLPETTPMISTVADS